MQKSLCKYLCALACFACAVWFASASVYGLDVLFERREIREVSRGVHLETNRMMTAQGMLDVHVLTIDVRQPYVTLSPVASAEIGLRETTASLLQDAIAGINADFFGMTGSHTTHFGAMASGGQVQAFNAHTNGPGATELFATYFLDTAGNSFFRYMHGQMRFFSNWASVDVVHKNTLGTVLWSPAVLTRPGYSTAALQYRSHGLTNIIVQNGRIIEITRSPAIVPPGGYVVVMPYAYRARAGEFRVGDAVTLTVCSDLRVDFSRIETAVGGGGLILQGGRIVHDDGAVPPGRHPRSAIGVTNTGRVVLMAVDGRTHSIGVTHEELAALLLQYSVTDAMHFDGGGSTTMVASDFFGTTYVVNTPSEGVQRQVVNALGVFDRSPPGALAGLGIWFESDTIGVAVSAQAYAFGVDAFGNRLPLPPGATLHAHPEAGFWRGDTYIPMRAGRHEVWVQYGNMRASHVLTAQEIASMHFADDIIELVVGEFIAPFRLYGRTTSGITVPIAMPTNYSVYPAIGFFHEGYFFAVRPGRGYIEARTGDVRAYVPFAVMDVPTYIGFGESFRLFRTHPENMAGTATTHNEEPGTIRLEYSMRISSETQAAYAEFLPMLPIPAGAGMIGLTVYGNESGHWMRGTVIDAAGGSHNIDFVRHMDFAGWRDVTAVLPDAPGPFLLQQVYMVSLRQGAAGHWTTRFRNLRAYFAPGGEVSIPQNTPFADVLQLQAPGRGIRQSFNVSRETIYSARQEGNFSVITMGAGGGIARADRAQWGRFWVDIARFGTNYILILLDTPPSAFPNRMEAELLHLALRDQAAAGRLVFVVSAGPESLEVRDGVRYIGIPGDAAQIHFYIDGASLAWSR